METTDISQADLGDFDEVGLKARRARKNRKRDAMENTDETSFDEAFDGAPKKRYVTGARPRSMKKHERQRKKNFFSFRSQAASGRFEKEAQYHITEGSAKDQRGNSDTQGHVAARNARV
jgi:hypothetical protein